MKTKKSLGQHFLQSPQTIKTIVKVSDTQKEDLVLEIGPGEGVLTSALLTAGANVISVEKDDRLIPILKEKFSKEIKGGQLNLIHRDILDVDMSKTVFDIKNRYKVVANIPYYITGQIIRMFLESNYQPESMTLLVQKEVAERIVAKGKNQHGKESLLSLSVKIYGTPKYIKTVGRGAFKPPPNVDSAILSIENISRRNLDGIDEGGFFEIIHAGFAHKRKQLLPNLSGLYPKEKLLIVFEKCGMDNKIRAEDVPLSKWLEICRILQTAI